MRKLQHLPTSQDVAHHAGVSRATVSYVLNATANQRISDATRARVLAAAHELGYQTNPLARALRRGRSDEISALARGPLTPFATEVIRAAQGFAREQGFLLAVYCGDGDAPERWRLMLEEIFARRPAGIIAPSDSITYEDVMRARVMDAGPCVVIGDHPLDYAPTITLPNAASGELAARHLLERPERRLVVVTPEGDRPTALTRRVEGMRRALREADREAALALPLGDGAEDSHALAERLLTMPPPLGVYVPSDALALPLLKALLERGARLPGDIALIGTDDAPASALVHPGLTTIRFDGVGLGQRLIALIARLSRDETPGADLFSLPPPLLTRRETT